MTDSVHVASKHNNRQCYDCMYFELLRDGVRNGLCYRNSYVEKPMVDMNDTCLFWTKTDRGG